MSAQNYADLVAHEGHTLSIYRYYTENVAIECEECHEVLLDFDNQASELGTCDKCEATYDVGSQVDHCADCGTCWNHCNDVAPGVPAGI